ncbi:MAG: ABC transporter [Chloroflexi bacterium RBG_16_69_14]|nr:MAG: ABC transporter [Chloroflexi bacterium RBG_16_69_14]
MTIVGRVLISILVPLLAFAILWQGFLFLRQNDAPKVVTGVIAVVWGVGGVAAIYWVMNWFLARLPERVGSRILPYLFVGPAMAILIWFLALPTLRTFWISLFNADSSTFVGLDNYVSIFTNPAMLEVFRNNFLWLVIGTTLVVGLGLMIAVLADQSRFESLAKAIIFMPMAISFVGAGIIWNFVYEVRQPGDPQIGLLNTIVTSLGGQPQAWTALLQPWNNLFLIVIMVWLQVGFAMVLFSAAIKGIPAELTEAARVDGATERQVFARVTVPMIRGTLITVATTTIILTLKIFDVVIVMTGGQFGTGVIGTEFYRQYFVNRNFGVGSGLAILLLIAVIPVMIYNLRRFRGQAGFR